MPQRPQLRTLADSTELIHLRWVAVAGQGVAVALAYAMELQTVAIVLAVLVGIGAASNLALELRRQMVSERGLAALIGLDVVLLTLMLAITGGALSPYTPLYLVYPVLAALLLRPAWAWSTLVLVLAAYAGLLLVGLPGSVHGAIGPDLGGHALGTYSAVGVASPFLVATLLRARESLTRSDARVQRARQAEERSRRLTSLATLAAGASHELASPLGTIAVASSELSRLAEPNSRIAEDAELIRSEVARCRMVLQELTADAGTTTGEPLHDVAIGDILDLIVVGYGDEIQVDLHQDLEDRPWTCPPRLIAQAVRRLVGNARAASGDSGTVRLAIDIVDDRLIFTVDDEGRGMSPDVLQRATEPFFTTRQTGSGMGLGLWFARTVAEQLGGGLQLTSAPGVGTTAVLIFRHQTRPDSGGANSLREP